MKGSPDHPPRVFLSHSHHDKYFVRRLAHDLAGRGARIWLDEAEMLVGDSLIEKIRQGIDEMDYVAVVLSRHSVNSEWVRREVDVAMNQEIRGRRVKVLPLLIDDSELPGFLLGKLFADFRKSEAYEDALNHVSQALELKDPRSPIMKAQGFAWPVPNFRMGKVLKVKVVFCTEFGLSFGEPRVGALVVANDQIHAAELPLSSIAQWHDIGPFEPSNARIAHFESNSWIEPSQTLAEASVRNGDYLIIVVGRARSIPLNLIVDELNTALEYLKHNEL
jgi:hypothetical protein